MRFYIPQEGEQYVVKRFALFPISSIDTKYWLEFIYLIRVRKWDNALKWYTWKEYFTSKKNYLAYRQYKRETGNKYFMSEKESPTPPNVGSGVMFPT